ncbi:ATP-grasp domain-containing protein [Streptomyces erythrochromogenes]|uniref:ATP-grasp domain-containing protein n=1 Tax=Streptomyces erythrochromogenes TaxID=285574 RepID=UPI0033F74908
MQRETVASDRPWLALVESNTTGTGRRFCAAARARGYRPVVLTRDPTRYPYVALDHVETLVVDTSDPSAVLDACGDLAEGAGLAGVTSSSEYFIAVAAAAAEKFGLPAADPRAIEQCRDKTRQRIVLANAGVAVPRFAEVTDAASAVRTAAAFGLPVVVKPVSGSGSIGVRLCTTEGDVESWAGELFATAGTNGRGRILVEEYVDGQEYSVETFDLTAVAVVGKHLGPAPHFVEVGHDFPAPSNTDDREQLTDTALRALSALGLGWGAAHTELRMSVRGPVVIEVNPRLAGGMIPTMVQSAGGLDLVDAVIARSVGRDASLRLTRNGHGAIRFLVARRPGVVSHVSELPHPDDTPGLVTASFNVSPGDRVEMTHSFRDRLGYAITTGGSTDEAGRAASRALARMHVEYRRPSE